MKHVFPVEFSVPLTPLLKAVVLELMRLQQLGDNEALEAAFEIIRPMLRNTDNPIETKPC